MLDDKEATSVLEPLLELVDLLIAVGLESPRAASPDQICAAIMLGGKRCIVASTTKEGLVKARELDAFVIMVTGSLRTAAEAREALGPSLEFFSASQMHATGHTTLR